VDQGLGGLISEGATTPANLLTGLVGTIQTGKGRILREKAERQFPPAVDPAEQALADQLQRRRRAFQTGTATARQREALAGQFKTGTTAAFRAGANARGINRIQQLINQGLLGLGQQEQAGELQFTGLLQGLTSKIADRRLQLGLLRQAQLRGEAAEATRAGRQNLGISFAKMVVYIKYFKKVCLILGS